METQKKTLIDEKTEPIIEILKRIIASAFVKNARPLSALIVGPIGGGKTYAIKKIAFNKNILALSDTTPYGLSKLLTEIRAKEIKHLIIFDLIEPMSRNRTVVNSLIGFLNSLIEEGIFRISTGFITINEHLRLGLISTTTKRELFNKRRGWLGIGFIQRMIPVTFTYSDVDVIQILEDLANQKYKDITPEVLELKSMEIEENPELNQLLIPYAQQIDKKIGQLYNPKTGKVEEEETMPFRRLDQLRIFLMANALLHGNPRVQKTDFEEFKKLVRLMNYDFNPL